MGWVRIALTYKFVFGSLVVAGASIAFPEFLRSRGLEFPAWGAFFIALGVGGGIGFLLSRVLGRKFEALLVVTERIRVGDLLVDIGLPKQSGLADETDELTRSLREMLVNLREMVARVQQTGQSVTISARDQTRSIQQIRTGNEGILSTVEAVAESVDKERELLGNAGTLIQGIASEIELNARRAREAFGFAAQANQKAGAGVQVAAKARSPTSQHSATPSTRLRGSRRRRKQARSS